MIVRRARLGLSWWVAVGLALMAAVVSAGFARADAPVLPSTDSLPWTDPAHQSPTEQFASRVASMINGGRSVRVLCEGENDWAALAATYKLPPLSGFVPWPRIYTSQPGRPFVSDAELVRLSPQVCLRLKAYGEASVKPTKCSREVQVVKTVYETVRYKTTVPAKVKKRVRVKGKWQVQTVVVKKTVWKTKRVAKQVSTVEKTDPEPCYRADTKTSVAGQSKQYWDDYYYLVRALGTLAHESIHLRQARAGASYDALLPVAEVQATCSAVQWVGRVAEQFGATPDDARAIAAYYWDYIYPTYKSNVDVRGYPYWSADCRQDGPLDLTPGDGTWP